MSLLKMNLKNYRQNYFNNDGTQLYVIFRQIYKTITTFSGLPKIFAQWESKGLSN